MISLSLPARGGEVPELPFSMPRPATAAASERLVSNCPPELTNTTAQALYETCWLATRYHVLFLSTHSLSPGERDFSACPWGSLRNEQRLGSDFLTSAEMARQRRSA